MKKVIVSLPIALLSFFIGVSSYTFTNKLLLNESYLISSFQENESQLNELVIMMKDDFNATDIRTTSVDFKLNENEYVYVYKDKPWDKSESEIGFSQRRWNEYLSLFEKTGVVERISRNSSYPNAIFILASCQSEDIEQPSEYEIIEIGFVYSTTELQPQIENFDNETGFGGRSGFKKIKENWYLYCRHESGKPE